MVKESKSKRFMKKFQLYYLFNELSNLIPNQDDLSILIGYDVLDATSSYKGRDPLEYRPQIETRRVYDGLENTIVLLYNGNEFDEVFLDLKQRTNQRVKQDSLVVEKEGFVLSDKIRSQVYLKFLDYLMNNDSKTEQLLRTYGLNLFDRVKDRGPLNSERRIVRQTDFSDICECLKKRTK